MADFHLDFDEKVLRNAVENALPKAESLGRVLINYAQRIANLWRNAVSGHTISGMSETVVNEDFSNQIYVSDVIDNNGLGEMSLSVYTTFERADDIEEGRPAFDLKPGLLGGPNAKVSE